MARDRVLDGIGLPLAHRPRAVGQDIQPLARSPGLEKQLCGTGNRWPSWRKPSPVGTSVRGAEHLTLRGERPRSESFFRAGLSGRSSQTGTLTVQRVLAYVLWSQ